MLVIGEMNKMLLKGMKGLYTCSAVVIGERNRMLFKGNIYVVLVMGESNRVVLNGRKGH